MSRLYQYQFHRCRNDDIVIGRCDGDHWYLNSQTSCEQIYHRGMLSLALDKSWCFGGPRKRAGHHQDGLEKRIDVPDETMM
jgi:hypothetical protein